MQFHKLNNLELNNNYQQIDTIYFLNHWNNYHSNKF
jgi:hypothetical protein